MVTPVCILNFDFARVFVSVTRHSLLRTCKIFQKRTNKSTRVLKTATTTTVCWAVGRGAHAAWSCHQRARPRSCVLAVCSSTHPMMLGSGSLTACLLSLQRCLTNMVCAPLQCALTSARTRGRLTRSASWWTRTAPWATAVSCFSPAPAVACSCYASAEPCVSVATVRLHLVRLSAGQAICIKWST